MKEMLWAGRSFSMQLLNLWKFCFLICIFYILTEVSGSLPWNSVSTFLYASNTGNPYFASMPTMNLKLNILLIIKNNCFQIF